MSLVLPGSCEHDVQFVRPAQEPGHLETSAAAAVRPAGITAPGLRWAAVALAADFA